MKLNKKGRDELRERVDLKLNDIEFNPDARIKLPLDILEEILFDYKKNDIYKKIAFISDNICKLDLSEVSFENVSYSSVKNINLSNTNGNYDFSKAYDYMDHGSLIVRNVNFENVDLSNQILKGEIYFANCNFRNTKLFPFWKDCETTLSSCDMRDNNLDKKTLIASLDDNISGDLFFAEKEYNSFFINSNLAGTGAHIEIEDGLSLFAYEFLNRLINAGYLDGCYLNDKRVLTKEENNSSRNEILRQYGIFKSERFNETIELIEKQTSNFGGRQNKLKLTLNNYPTDDENSKNKE